MKIWVAEDDWLSQLSCMRFWTVARVKEPLI